MKILLCTNTFNHVTHGPAKFANLILEINQIYKEHKINILTEDVEVSYENIYKMNVNLPRYFNPLSQIFRMFLYHKSAKQIYKVYPFDIVIYNNSFLGLINTYFKKGYITAGMVNDDNNLSVSLKNFQWRYLWFKSFFFKQLEKKSVKRHDIIISNSNYLSKQISVNYPISENKVFRLYKAIDISISTIEGEKGFKQPYKILFVKSDYKRGGLETLATALAILKYKKFEVTVIGPEKKFGKSILNMFKEENIEVNFLGEQSQEVVQRFMIEADIFCVPSQKEALGVANIEALAAGTSVITTNVGGIPEVMDYGNNGWMVNPNQPKELAAAIEDCIKNENERSKKSLNGKKFIEKFSKEQMFTNFLEIIENACNTKNFQIR